MRVRGSDPEEGDRSFGMAGWMGSWQMSLTLESAKSF